jgi:dihydroorotate dehydrogenase
LLLITFAYEQQQIKAFQLQPSMGLEFPNPVGLAAGLDKNGECIDGLAGWASASSKSAPSRRARSPATPSRACSACRSAQAIINRMGFNNRASTLIANVSDRAKLQGHSRHQHRQELRHADRARRSTTTCLPAQGVHALASYVTVNISSPNTKNLRQLQGESELDALLGPLKASRKSSPSSTAAYVPLALKIAPDLDERRSPPLPTPCAATASTR